MADVRKKRADSRAIHRALGVVVGLLALYIGVTGTIVQTVDLRAILSGAPATNPDMVAIRESINGPSSYSVIDTPDYAAASLDPALDLPNAVQRATKAARAVANGAPFHYVEFRMLGARPVVRILAGDRRLQFDAVGGAQLPDAASPPAQQGPAPSGHLLAKRWHRMWALGDAMLWLNALVGIALFAMVVTGLAIYLKLVRARRRIGRHGLFWSAGGWLRTTHRAVSLVAALILLEVATTGTLLSIDSFALQIYKSTHSSKLVHGQVVAGMVADYSGPLSDVAIASMPRTSLSAYHEREGAIPIKVLRLRSFAGMLQAVFVTGEDEPRQLVFNAVTGARASMTEPGYPYMGFPTGWELHELLKRIHRGDVIGVPGRLMDLFAGLSLVFLSGSGLWMYLDLWRRRRAAGRTALFWS